VLAHTFTLKDSFLGKLFLLSPTIISRTGLLANPIMLHMICAWKSYPVTDVGTAAIAATRGNLFADVEDISVKFKPKHFY